MTKWIFGRPPTKEEIASSGSCATFRPLTVRPTQIVNAGVHESADLGASASGKKLRLRKEDVCKSNDDCVILFNFILLSQIVDMILDCQCRPNSLS